MNTKKCIACFQVKEERQFYQGRNKIFSKFLECHKKEMRMRYQMNKDIIREKQRVKAAAVREACKAMRTMELV